MGREWSGQKAYRNWTEKALVSGSTVTNTHSVVFNGTDEDITYGDILDKTNTDAWTLSIWLEPANNTQTNVALVSKQIRTGTYRGIHVVQNGTGLNLFFIGDASSNYLDLSVGSFLAGNTRVHLVITTDGTGTAAGTKIYKNGSVTSPTVNRNDLSQTLSNAAPWRIAARGVTAEGFWAGKADWFSMYNKVLNSTEVTELYNSGTASDPSSMSFAANLDLNSSLGESGDDLESAGGILDLTGNGYTGTGENLTNAANKSTDIT